MNSATAYKHVGSKQLDDVRMLLKLSIPDPAAEGILECALKVQPEVVEHIIDKGQLHTLAASDPEWWCLLSSLHTLGQRVMDGDAADFPPFFRLWWDTYYPQFGEWALYDNTVFGSQDRASIFDGQRNIHVDL